MPKNAMAKFYWKDWRADEELRRCCLAAKGLWIDMLCIAAAAKPVGYILLQGRPATNADLAKATGATEPEIEALLGELQLNGVFSRDKRGRIYSRRLVRDEKRRRDGIKSGRLGGNPTLSKQTKNRVTLKGQDKTTLNGGRSPTIPLNPLSTVPQHHLAAVTARVCEALGVTLTKDTRRANWPRQIDQMLQSGLDLELDILPACAEARSRSIENLNWVRKNAEGNRERRGASTPLPSTENTNEHGWRNRLAAFHKTNVWPVTWGPPRGEVGHLCPDPVWKAFDAGRDSKAA